MDSFCVIGHWPHASWSRKVYDIERLFVPFCVQGNEGRLYEFIVRHFLACVSQDALGQETVVDIDIAQERFSASGLMIIARNYLDVYPYDRWSTKVLCVCVCVFYVHDILFEWEIMVKCVFACQLIPVYEQGSQFQPTAIEMVDGQTSPPQLLTEADLIALMEKHGIGKQHWAYVVALCYIKYSLKNVHSMPQNEDVELFRSFAN